MDKINKPWGSEHILEKNEHYVVKLLKMFQGHKCSLQYHEKKVETFYVLYGTMKLHIGNNGNSVILKAGDHYHIDQNVVHRMEALSYIEYLEMSTPELDDVVRLKDDYERV